MSASGLRSFNKKKNKQKNNNKNFLIKEYCGLPVDE